MADRGRLIGRAEVRTRHIKDDQITLAKMAAGTDGNLITYDTSGDPAAVVTGSATSVLTSKGAGAAPTFDAVATQAQLEADQPSATAVVSAVNLRHHKGVAKVWVDIGFSGGATPSNNGDYNVDSIGDTAQGRVTVTLADDFSSAVYVVAGMSTQTDSDDDNLSVESRAAGSFIVQHQKTGGGDIDEDFTVAAFGDQ